MSWLTVGAAAEAIDTPLDGVRWLIGAGFLAAFTDTDGVTWVDPDDVRRQRAGLNDAPVAETLRDVADPWERAGVALRVMQALQGEIADLNDVLVGAVAELLDTGHQVVEIAERLACEPDALPVPGRSTPMGEAEPPTGPLAGATEGAPPEEAAEKARASGAGVQVAEEAEVAVDGGAERATGSAASVPSSGPAPEPQVEVEGSGRPEVERAGEGVVEGSTRPAPAARGEAPPGPPADRSVEVAPDADLTAPVRLVEPPAREGRTAGGTADDDGATESQPRATGLGEDRGRSIVVDELDEIGDAALPARLEEAEADLGAPGAEVDEEVGAAVLEFRRAAGDDQPSVGWALPGSPRPDTGGAGRSGPSAVDLPPQEEDAMPSDDEDQGPGIGWGPIDVSAIARTVTADVGAIARTVTTAVGRVLSALGWR